VKYADARAARRPIGTVEIPPRVWAQTWTERPLEAVTCGWRSLGETVLSEVTGAALTRANAQVPGGDETSALWRDEFNASVRMITIGRALTQPDCADVPWWSYPDMIAPMALSPEGAAWLFARYEVALVSASILASEEAPAELLATLVAARERFATLTPAKASQASRHLRTVLDILGGA
jgi:hypothetical protein